MEQKEIFELIDKFENSRLAEVRIESEHFRIILKSPEATARPAAVPLSGFPAPPPALLFRGITPRRPPPARRLPPRRRAAKTPR